MNIYLRDNRGNRLGCISGNEIRDAHEHRVGAVVNGNEIWDAHEHKVGAVVNGNEIWDAREHKVGAVVNGNEIWDARGHTMGSVDGNASKIQIGAAGLLLFGLDAQQTNSMPVSTSSADSEEKSGCLAFIVGVILYGFFKALWSYLKGPFVELSYLKETAARKEWWGTCIRSLLLSVFIGGILMAILLNIIKGDAGIIIACIFWLAFGLLPIIAVSIRRMHDIGKKGWWILIPIVGFVMCGFFPGKIDGNKYI